MHYTHEGSTEEENTSSLNERSSDQLGNRAVGGGGGFTPPSSHPPFESRARICNPLKEPQESIPRYDKSYLTSRQAT
jgi:hypothetical protein